MLPPERLVDCLADCLVAAVDPLLDRLDALVDDRARVLPEPVVAAPELREPGGVDVRVAMLLNLRDRHFRHRDHTPHRCQDSPVSQVDAAPRAPGRVTAPVRGSLRAMKLYADSPARRLRQLLTDAALVVWTVGWILLAKALHDAVLLLARPAQGLSDGSAGLADRLRAAGSAVDGTPLVGDDLRAPLDDAGGAAEQIASAGTAQVEAVERLALSLALPVALIPVLLALAVHLTVRWRFVRAASAGQRFVDSATDLDLFALRALSNQPLHRLARISPDPAAAWRNRDPSVVRRLAELELRSTGLTPPPRRG